MQNKIVSDYFEHTHMDSGITNYIYVGVTTF